MLITEGFNDRNRREPSVNGVTPGFSAAAFVDDLGALVGQMRSDWIAAGKSSSDLSFTLVGMYHDGGYSPLMDEYATAEAAMAAADPQISFIDLADKAPDLATAEADGYMFFDSTTGTYDPTHLSRNGALVYSQMVMDGMVPEPAMATAAIFFGLALTRRNRR